MDEVDDCRSTLAYCLRELLSPPSRRDRGGGAAQQAQAQAGQLPPEVNRYWVGQHLQDIWVVYPWDAPDIDAHEAAIRASGR